PIQLQAIPPVMQGRDVMGLAQTGTGKTAAFVLPILQRLLNGPRGRVRALILAPTRELAEQIHEAIGALGKQTGLRSMTIYGGVGTHPQVMSLRRGVDTVSHALYPVPQHLKTALLMELLRLTDTESVLVFARTKHRARRLGEQLEKAGYRVASLQGNLSQNRRQAALDGFRDGTYQILVATDIAARGIDVTG